MTARDFLKLKFQKHFFRNFENANKKLEKKLNGIKQEINQVMEASSVAHEQREEAKHKTILLRERAEKDLAQYATDIKVKSSPKN